MSENYSPPTIAIVGGGFSGSLVATHLLRKATCPLNIKLIERRPNLGRGVAYGTNSPLHLLNVPAGKMSAFPDRPDHFLRWLQTQDSREALVAADVKVDTFVQRKIYGAYVGAVLEEAIAAAADKVHFEALTDEAIAIQPEAEGATVYLNSGQALQAHRIVLALGNFPPSDPPVSDRSFYSSQRYIGYAWSANALTDLYPDDPVLLIGSGLTMLDLAVALSGRGHTGIIHVVSRHGLLPHSHKPTQPYPPFLDAENAPKKIRDLVKRVRQEVQAALASGQDWRAAIDSLRPAIQQLWQALPLSEQRRFLRHVRPYWEVHRHRVAPEVANTITSLLRSQQLVVHPGCIQAYREDERGVDVVVRARGSENSLVLRVARVINCTGPQCDYRKFTHPLIVHLRNAGLIQPDALGLGLAVAPNGALLDEGGVASPCLYTLGSPRKGILWETTAVAEIRVQAMQLADEIMRSLEVSRCKHK